MMFYFKTVLVLILHVLKGVDSLTVTIFPNKEGILGQSDLRLNCVFKPSTGEEVLGLNIQAEIVGSFVDIASFSGSLNGHANFSPAGHYLSKRVNLSNPTPSTPNTATIIFNEIKCQDEIQYKCKIVYKTSSGQFDTVFSDSTSIVVKGMPSVPDHAPVWTPKSKIEEVTDVTFTCTGNVGKPAGRFRWTKYRGSTPTFYDSVTTTSVVMPGTCTFNGTSSLTLTLQAEDNNAVIKCEVVQELATSNMYRQTLPDDLVVYYKVRNTNVVRSPDLPTYAEGSTSITFTCSAQGNPPPTFEWYKSTDMTTVLTTGSTFVLGESDVVVCNAGTYRCIGLNTVNGKDYEMIAEVNIRIERTTSTSAMPTTFPSTSTVISTDILKTCSDGKETCLTDTIGVVTFFILLQIAELVLLFVLYKTGKIMFKWKKEKVYEDVTHNRADVHVYASMNM